MRAAVASTGAAVGAMTLCEPASVTHQRPLYGSEYYGSYGSYGSRAYRGRATTNAPRGGGFL